MEVISILTGASLLGISMTFILRPFQQQKAGHFRQSDAARPQARRESVLSALRELDFDFKVGKVSEEDYVPLRARLLEEAAQLMQQDQEQEERLEALIESRRGGRQVAGSCPQCGAGVGAGEKFCAKCGSALAKAACPSCGKEIKPGDLFCPACGSRIERRMEATQQ